MKPASTPPAPVEANPRCNGVAQSDTLPPLSSASAAAIISDRGTALDAYQREGGVWLERSPVLINRDFDFALSMSLENGVGAGLAAAKRREGNTDMAVLLREVALSPELTGELDALRACGQHVYFVLWGPEEEAVLRLVGEVAHERATAPVIIEGVKLQATEWQKPQALSLAAGALLEQFAAPHGAK